MNDIDWELLEKREESYDLMPGLVVYLSIVFKLLLECSPTPGTHLYFMSMMTLDNISKIEKILGDDFNFTAVEKAAELTVNDFRRAMKVKYREEV